MVPVPVPVTSVQKLTSIPASLLQNVTNKSCLVGAKNKKYAFWSASGPWGQRGKVKLSYFVTILSAKQPSEAYQNFSQCFITSLVLSQAILCVAHLRCTQGRPLLREAKPSYVYLILKRHGQSSRSPVRLLSAKRSQATCTQFENHVVRVLEAQSNCCYTRRSRATYTQFQNHMVRVPKALSDHCEVKPS